MLCLTGPLFPKAELTFMYVIYISEHFLHSASLRIKNKKSSYFTHKLNVVTISRRRLNLFYSISYDWKDGFPKNLVSLVSFDYPGGNHINTLHVISL